MRTYRRIAAVALGVSVVAMATATLLSPLRVSADGPSAPSLPDFTNGVPYQESAPTRWAFDVVTGGLRAGQTVTFRFDFKNAPPDHLHAVAFGTLTPNRQDVTIVDYPLDFPGPSLRPTGCPTATGSAFPNSYKVDPYAQTITLVIDPPGFTAGHLLQFCLQSVGFPVIPDTASDYGVTYTEPSGPPVRIAYNVGPQGSASHQIHVHDSDGYEMTNAGIGGGRLATYTTTYTVDLHGDTNATYYYTTGYQSDAKLNITFGSPTVITVGGVVICPNPTPPPGQVTKGVFCTDSNGDASGVLQITSDQPDVLAYVEFDGAEQPRAAGISSSPPVYDLFSVTVGPPNARPPTPKATPSPTATSSSGGLPSPFDAQCIAPYFGNAGLGSLEVYEANIVAITRAFADECPQISSLVTYTGVNDTVALTQLFSTYGTPYAFAGLDRAMTHQEFGNCTTGSGPPCGNNGAASSGNFGIMQFPIDLQPLLITYNLPNSSQCQTAALQASPRLLNAIFTGVVTRWNDQLVTAENSGLGSCNAPILVAHDVGIASAVLKDYLSKQNAQWNAYKDPAAADAWPATAPTSCTANGSDAMALCVLGRPGTIGYGFYHAIHRAGLPWAAVATTAGNVSTSSPLSSQPAGYFTGSPVDGCTTAAETYPAFASSNQSPLTRSDWSAISLTDWAQGYPICTFNFLVTATSICRSSADVHTSRGFRAYLGAILSPYGQRKLAEQGYSRLPDNVLGIDSAGMSSLGAGGCYS
jgi:ABC-type phosphate transport system substrate-binding protein